VITAAQVANTDATTVVLDLRPVPTAAGCKQQRDRFNILVAPRRDELFRYACWLTGDRDIADDLVQETLVRAWRSITALENPKAIKSWLLAIMHHENARRFAHIQVKLSSLPVEDIACPRAHYDTSTDAYVLRQALRALPRDVCVPLLMQVLGGYSLKGIALRLGITAAGVGTRLFRARKKLRTFIGDPD